MGPFDRMLSGLQLDLPRLAFGGQCLHLLSPFSIHHDARRSYLRANEELGTRA